MLPLITPFAIVAAAASLGYSISVFTAMGLILCVLSKMADGDEFITAVKKCLAEKL